MIVYIQMLFNWMATPFRARHDGGESVLSIIIKTLTFQFQTLAVMASTIGAWPSRKNKAWIPACAGMTGEENGMTGKVG
jgi:hypothetical protein